MELEGLLLCLQQPATGYYSELDEPSPQRPNIFLDHGNPYARWGVLVLGGCLLRRCSPAPGGYEDSEVKC
jgi:hypothetical protein